MKSKIVFFLLLFVISRMLFALCSASFCVRLLPFGLIDIFYMFFFCFYSYFVCVCRCLFFPWGDFECIRRTVFASFVYCSIFVSVLFTWFSFNGIGFYGHVRLDVWNRWWLWHGHQIAIITVQIDVTICFWLAEWNAALWPNVWTLNETKK